MHVLYRYSEIKFFFPRKGWLGKIIRGRKPWNNKTFPLHLFSLRNILSKNVFLFVVALMIMINLKQWPNVWFKSFRASTWNVSFIDYRTQWLIYLYQQNKQNNLFCHRLSQFAIRSTEDMWYVMFLSYNISSVCWTSL